MSFLREYCLGDIRGGQDYFDEVLRGKGKLPSKWADSLDNAVSDQDEMDVSDEEARSAGG